MPDQYMPYDEIPEGSLGDGYIGRFSRWAFNRGRKSDEQLRQEYIQRANQEEAYRRYQAEQERQAAIIRAQNEVNIPSNFIDRERQSPIYATGRQYVTYPEAWAVATGERTLEELDPRNREYSFNYSTDPRLRVPEEFSTSQIPIEESAAQPATPPTAAAQPTTAAQDETYTLPRGSTSGAEWGEETVSASSGIPLADVPVGAVPPDALPRLTQQAKFPASEFNYASYPDTSTGTAYGPGYGTHITQQAKFPVNPQAQGQVQSHPAPQTSININPLEVQEGYYQEPWYNPNVSNTVQVGVPTSNIRAPQRIMAGYDPRDGRYARGYYVDQYGNVTVPYDRQYLQYIDPYGRIPRSVYANAPNRDPRWHWSVVNAEDAALRQAGGLYLDKIEAAFDRMVNGIQGGPALYQPRQVTVQERPYYREDAGWQTQPLFHVPSRRVSDGAIIDESGGGKTPAERLLNESGTPEALQEHGKHVYFDALQRGATEQQATMAAVQAMMDADEGFNGHAFLNALASMGGISDNPQYNYMNNLGGQASALAGQKKNLESGINVSGGIGNVQTSKNIVVKKGVNFNNINDELKTRANRLADILADEFGMKLYISSGYRTAAEQAALLKSGRGHKTAQPGRSPHQHGRAFDVALNSGMKPQFAKNEKAKRMYNGNFNAFWSDMVRRAGLYQFDPHGSDPYHHSLPPGTRYGGGSGGKKKIADYSGAGFTRGYSGAGLWGAPEGAQARAIAYGRGNARQIKGWGTGPGYAQPHDFSGSPLFVQFVNRAARESGVNPQHAATFLNFILNTSAMGETKLGSAQIGKADKADKGTFGIRDITFNGLKKGIKRYGRGLDPRFLNKFLSARDVYDMTTEEQAILALMSAGSAEKAFREKIRNGAQAVASGNMGAIRNAMVDYISTLHWAGGNIPLAIRQIHGSISRARARGKNPYGVATGQEFFSKRLIPHYTKQVDGFLNYIGRRR